MISSTPLIINCTPMQTSRKPISREMASMPPLPTRRIIAPELRRQAHRITPNSKDDRRRRQHHPLREVHAVLNGRGGANNHRDGARTGGAWHRQRHKGDIGGRFILQFFRFDLRFHRIVGFCWGNSMRKPIKATINPPAIRSPVLICRMYSSPPDRHTTTPSGWRRHTPMPLTPVYYARRCSYYRPAKEQRHGCEWIRQR